MGISEVLTCAAIPSMYTLLKQQIPCYVGHVRRMEDDRSPKDLLYCLSTVVRDEIPGLSSPKLGSCLQARQISDVDTEQ